MNLTKYEISFMFAKLSIRFTILTSPFAELIWKIGIESFHIHFFNNPYFWYLIYV